MISRACGNPVERFSSYKAPIISVHRENSLCSLNLIVQMAIGQFDSDLGLNYL